MPASPVDHSGASRMRSASVPPVPCCARAGPAAPGHLCRPHPWPPVLGLRPATYLCRPHSWPPASVPVRARPCRARPCWACAPGHLPVPPASVPVRARPCRARGPRHLCRTHPCPPRPCCAACAGSAAAPGTGAALPVPDLWPLSAPVPFARAGPAVTVGTCAACPCRSCGHCRHLCRPPVPGCRHPRHLCRPATCPARAFRPALSPPRHPRTGLRAARGPAGRMKNACAKGAGVSRGAWRTVRGRWGAPGVAESSRTPNSYPSIPSKERPAEPASGVPRTCRT